MKDKVIYFVNFLHQICWIILLFIVLTYTKNQNMHAQELHPRKKGEHKIDSVSVPPCEHPAYMSGRDTDTSHITKFVSVGRKICMTVFIKNVKQNKQRFFCDTCCRDSLVYVFKNRNITKYECARLVHSLYDCNDSLLSKKVIIFYNKDFVHPNWY